MPVVVRDAFRDPKAARVRRAGEIPWPQLNRPQTLHVPHVKEFMRNCIERLFIRTRVAELARLNNFCRRQVLHAVARVSIVRKMNQKRVRIELGLSPHRRFRAHNFFDVAHQRGALATFASH